MSGHADIYLMIISEIQSEIGHCSCDSEKFKAPADFSHVAILLFDIVLNVIDYNYRLHCKVIMIVYDYFC